MLTRREHGPPDGSEDRAAIADPLAAASLLLAETPHYAIEGKGHTQTTKSR